MSPNGNSTLKLVYSSTAYKMVDMKQDFKNRIDLQGNVECYVTITTYICFDWSKSKYEKWQVGKSLRGQNI